MEKIVKNKYLDALFKLMILSSVIHMGVVIFYSITNLSLTKLNIFNILALDLLSPILDKGIISIIAALITIELYLLFLFTSDKE